VVTKKRIAHFIRNVLISILVLIVVFVGAGAIYTWVVGKSAKPVPTVTEDTTTVKTTTIKSPQIDPNAPESVSVQSLTTPVAPGENASVLIKTNPGSWCTIIVSYNEVNSKDSGLVGKTSDEFGSVTWTWTVDASAPEGKWPVKVTCVRNSKSAVVIGDLIVKAN
jgi:hypothetical protein